MDTDVAPPLPHQLEQFNLLDAQIATLDDSELAPGQPQQCILIFRGVPAWSTGAKHYMTALDPNTALAYGQSIVDTAIALGAGDPNGNPVPTPGASGLVVAQTMAQAKQVADQAAASDRLRG